MIKNLAILMAAALVAGCGYVSSGNWEDDAGNWGRAFQSTQPGDVVVVHSLYWHTPHWTYEAGICAKSSRTKRSKNSLITENHLRQLKGADLGESERPCFGECPEWFAPKSIDDYEVWGHSNVPGSMLRVFIEKKTRRMFVGDYTV